jgi:hypothetical protein
MRWQGAKFRADCIYDSVLCALRQRVDVMSIDWMTTDRPTPKRQDVKEYE